MTGGARAATILKEGLNNIESRFFRAPSSRQVTFHFCLWSVVGRRLLNLPEATGE